MFYVTVVLGKACFFLLVALPARACEIDSWLYKDKVFRNALELSEWSTTFRACLQWFLNILSLEETHTCGHGHMQVACSFSVIPCMLQVHISFTDP